MHVTIERSFFTGYKFCDHRFKFRDLSRLLNQCIYRNLTNFRVIKFSYHKFSWKAIFVGWLYKTHEKLTRKLFYRYTCMRSTEEFQGVCCVRTRTYLHESKLHSYYSRWTARPRAIVSLSRVTSYELGLLRYFHTFFCFFFAAVSSLVFLVHKCNSIMNDREPVRSGKPSRLHNLPQCIFCSVKKLAVKLFSCV